jgi:branched-chain amino acid transport system permease protein
MDDIFGIPVIRCSSAGCRRLLGLINGAFYALLSLGLAVIFGMLNVINFAHGAQFMMGAFVAWMLLEYAGLNYWWALILAPLLVGPSASSSNADDRRLYKLDHLYGLLLTFGLGLIIEGVFRNQYGSSGLPYRIPPQPPAPGTWASCSCPSTAAGLSSGSLVMCLATWLVIEKTKIGSYLRASTENAALVQAFGINVPRLMTLTYGAGVALAAFAGVLAAPIYSVNPQMGSNLIIIVFAVVVIGGMGSILGSVITGFGLGVIEGLTKVFYPEGSSTVIFVVMAIVLLARPAGLFGRA